MEKLLVIDQMRIRARRFAPFYEASTMPAIDFMFWVRQPESCHLWITKQELIDFFNNCENYIAWGAYHLIPSRRNEDGTFSALAKLTFNFIARNPTLSTFYYFRMKTSEFYSLYNNHTVQFEKQDSLKLSWKVCGF